MEASVQFLLRIFLHHHQKIPRPNLARILFTIPGLIHYFDLIRDLIRYPDFDGPDVIFRSFSFLIFIWSK